HKPGRAIDIGCGTGTNVVTLARAGWQMTGVDFAPRAVKLARKKIAESGVRGELLVGDVTKLEGIDGPFDLAFDLGCFHGLSEAAKTQYLTQLDRILAPGGFWLMYGFLRADARPAAPGLGEADLSGISARFALLSRRDGFDDHRARGSAWFLFQKREQAPA
ncbi:MAG: class I SAM-dependent methyltransferase, partial [Anaerolineales bacterium]